ncbi:MAG: hypothetical protein RIR33_3145 [Pseudomonadota bacterium]|jgi:hypothetical protein
MNLPFERFIFINPDWTTLPIRIWLACVFLTLLVLAFRGGRSGAVEAARRYRWFFLATLIPAVAWGLYGYAVLNPGSIWAR